MNQLPVRQRNTQITTSINDTQRNHTLTYMPLNSRSFYPNPDWYAHHHRNSSNFDIPSLDFLLNALISEHITPITDAKATNTHNHTATPRHSRNNSEATHNFRLAHITQHTQLQMQRTQLQLTARRSTNDNHQWKTTTCNQSSQLVPICIHSHSLLRNFVRTRVLATSSGSDVIGAQMPAPQSWKRHHSDPPPKQYRTERCE